MAPQDMGEGFEPRDEPIEEERELAPVLDECSSPRASEDFRASLREQFLSGRFEAREEDSSAGVTALGVFDLDHAGAETG